MGQFIDVPTRPHRPPPRLHEGWRGAAAVVLSLSSLAACIGLATAVGLADRFPSTLDRYQPPVAGQSSLYRVQYQNGSAGFATSNVVKPSNDALAYVATYATGHTVQVHSTYTNWLGTGALHSSDDYYARNGEQLTEVARLEAGITTQYSPPIEAWSPELLRATLAKPLRGSTTVNGTQLDYTAWHDPDDRFTLPGGQQRPALHLETQLSFSGTVVTHSDNWFVAGVGLVRSKLTDGKGQMLQSQDLLASTELGQSTSAAALPLDELLAGAGNQSAFFREDTARTGARPDAQIDAAQLRVTYRLQTGENMSASPVFAGGTFYVADANGRLAAIDAYQAVPRWQFSAGGPIVAAPAVAGGIVYFGAADKTFYAVDAQRGMYIWSYRMRDNVAAAAVVADGVVYAGGEDRTLYALDARTGQRRWSQTTGDRLVSSPAVADGRVIIGSDDGVLYAFDATKGRLLWRYAMDGPVEATPAISPEGVVFAASNGQELAALDAATGKQLWTASTRFGYLASPAAGQGRVFDGGTDGIMHAYDARTGTTAWEARSASGAGFVGSPLVVGSSVLAADTDGELTVWDSASGTVQLKLNVGGSVVSSPTWTGQAVLVADAAGEVLTLQSDPNIRSVSLTTQWEHEFGGGSADPVTNGLFAQPVWLKGRPYVVLHNGSLWSVDPTSGDATQVGALGEPVSANPVVSDGVLYAATETGRVVAFDPANGQQKWNAAVSGSVRFGPAVSDAAVFVNTFSPTQTVVAALDRATGGELWTRAFGNGNSTPALADGRLYVASEAITALDPNSGAVLWKSDPFVAFGCLASYDGIVYAGRGAGQGASFVALDGATGKLLWSATDPAQFSYGRPAFDAASQSVIAGATDGELFAYDARTGEARWHFQADSPIKSDLQVQGGVVYFAAFSGDLYAVQAASGRLLTNFRPGTPINTIAAPLLMPDQVYAAQGIRLFSLALEAH